MSHPLGSLDAAFWALESAHAPMHLGALALFGPGADPRPARLAGVLAERATTLPALRRRVVQSWLPHRGPRWEDDPAFDPSAHIHVHEEPGADLPTQVADLMARPLDRGRPPWEFHLLLPGRADQGFALLAKLHHAAVDGLRAVELGIRLVDEWQSAPPPRPRRPRPVPPAPPLWSRLADEGRKALGAAELAAEVVRAIRPLPSPLEAAPGAPRRVVLPTLPLEQVQRIRRAAGGTVHDVVLAAVAGALRAQLPDPRDLRVLVPVSQRSRAGGAVTGNQLSGYLVTLPCGEPDPLRRLARVSADMAEHKRRGPKRGAGAMALLTDRAPAASMRLAAPWLRPTAPLLFDALVTTVPLPDVPLTLAGAPLTAVHPLPPLPLGHGLGIAVSSYRGALNLGLYGSVDVAAIGEALHRELSLLEQALGPEPVTTPASG
ncbi:wax ester/triacylglycerol synthase domain-containing protein [Streptacidiphilus monticola]|uniref:diacylglycerol O-acyltransferase n=1 Tax=Streptacidiphilus monticola TaxID=2161674 RepID=A0ABW1GBZ9_9ACTN